MTKFVYQCSNCGKRYQRDEVRYLCPLCACDSRPGIPLIGVLSAQFDYCAIRKMFRKEKPDWNLFSAVEEKFYPPIPVGNTPFFQTAALGQQLGLDNIWIKNDGLNPSASLKDRASFLVVAEANRLKEKTIVAASTGNAASALAAVCAVAGRRALIFVPENAPKVKLVQMILYGATVIPVCGTYDDAFRLSLEYTAKRGGLNRNTAYHPLTIEGKKTVGLELCQQNKWRVPDAILVPVGDGVIISGVHKAFSDLKAAGLISRLPRLVCVQAEKSNAIHRYVESGIYGKAARPDTIADSISVSIPSNAHMARKAVLDSGGFSITVSDDEILDGQQTLAAWTGVFAEPASSATVGGVNYLEIPPAITGVKARVIGLVGKYFPTGAHKVGAAFGCLVPRLVSGEFDPEKHKAAWPSTGNYCRGGAFDCAVLGCTAIAILPQGMSRERFEWLKKVGAEIIATPGCESNVKEIYDKCWELKRDPANVIFNQFEEFGNPIFHYNVTGLAVKEVFQNLFETVKRRDGETATSDRKLRAAAFVSATGSAGTIAAGDYLKTKHPSLKIVVAEALQCPTLLMNGFGDHRIEGIGDKHIPWVHNVRNTDAVAAIDDEDCMRILRLFNEPAGQKHLASLGVKAGELKSLPLLGISGICNLLAAIKTAKHFELTERDMIFTVFTDSTELYGSRVEELKKERGAYRAQDAIADFAGPLAHQSVDYFKELTYPERKAIHNLKYFTWVEQQGKTCEELNAQWDPEYWRALFEDEVAQFDQLIEDFNGQVRRAD